MRPDWIQFDVAQHGQKMLVLLDGKRLEPALPDMAAGLVPPVIPSDMRRQQPLYPSSQATGEWQALREKKRGHSTFLGSLTN